MSKYNKEYEGYYSKIIERQRMGPSYREYKPISNDGEARYNSYNIKDGYYVKKPLFDFSRDGIVKRFISELIGVALLTIIICLCKFTAVSQINWIYTYGKNSVNTNLDYKQVLAYDYLGALNNLKGKFDKTADFKNELENYIDTFKSKVTGEKTQKEKIKESYVLPLNGKIKADSEKLIEDKGVIIEGKALSEAICSYDGKVKTVGEDKKLGKYIIVDHGDGIETKYYNLKEVSVKEGDKLGKGELLGKIAENKNLNVVGIIFELSIMGENRDLKEYFKL
ncbi:Peptidase family M23 [Clostridium cavendishii DSM 21758]|uniref:Peptidase family M23 n=1 Tax=Clostridium cavendishii DSM 21758 TaxID=1121302 RepID=A0A1M6BJ99_9CLOT|nr:M23 family metallopeptidase [Clostridium cavendishii]SHI48860.1 Peptidase family M23 [Clostridium cavendishii DSM 21758]